jgi:branched-chain amino acid transport system substrate-binding protein
MKRTIVTVVAGLFAILAVQAGHPPRAGAQQKPVKLALIAPLSGAWARQGYLKKLGAEMAVDEINAAGGIKSLGGAKIELVIADASDSAEKAKNAAQRLVSQEPDLSGGMGAWLSTFTLAVTEVTEREHLPWLTLSYSDAITGRGFRYVFQSSPTGGDQAVRAVPTIFGMALDATGRKPASAGIIMDNTASPVSFTKPIREGGLEKMGIKLAMDEIFTPPLSDATPLVQRVRSTRPDFLFLVSTSVPDDKLILEKMHEFKLGRDRVPVVANGVAFASPELLKTMGQDQLEGLLVITPSWGVKGQEELIARFKQRTGEPWLTQDSLSTYGHVWIFKEALEKARSADREQVAEAIRQLDVASGPVALAFPGGAKFDAAGRRQRTVVLVVQWQNGVPVTVYPPQYAFAKPKWPKG